MSSYNHEMFWLLRIFSVEVQESDEGVMNGLLVIVINSCIVYVYLHIENRRQKFMFTFYTTQLFLSDFSKAVKFNFQARVETFENQTPAMPPIFQQVNSFISESFQLKEQSTSQSMLQKYWCVTNMLQKYFVDAQVGLKLCQNLHIKLQIYDCVATLEV